MSNADLNQADPAQGLPGPAAKAHDPAKGAGGFWHDKVVVISGAASGIGEALARALAPRGARLCLVDLHEERLKTLEQDLRAGGAHTMSRVMDVAQLDNWQRLAADSAAQWGPANVVINNAGVSLIEPLHSMAAEDARWIMGINFWGVWNGCKAYQPQMTDAGRGTLVNISSIFAMVSMPTQSMYNAAKAAVRGFSDALREEVRDAGLQVLCVHPGGIKTRIVEQARFGQIAALGMSAQQMKDNFQLNAMTTSNQAAQQIVAAVEAGRTRLLIGRDAKVLDVLFRLLPASASARFTKLARRRAGHVKT